ncbi:MAG: hypothetical protein ACTHM5_21090 [Ginsengibacter sp.]
MLLVNLKENIPDEFFVFINLKSFITKNNYENSKTFNSAAFGELSMNNTFLKKYLNGTVELSRRYNFPLYPSRLSATYAFEDYNSCVVVNKKYQWDLSTVRRFKLNPHPFNIVAKVNMEIISLEDMQIGFQCLTKQLAITFGNTIGQGKEICRWNYQI